MIMLFILVLSTLVTTIDQAQADGSSASLPEIKGTTPVTADGTASGTESLSPSLSSSPGQSESPNVTAGSTLESTIQSIGLSTIIMQKSTIYSNDSSLDSSELTTQLIGSTVKHSEPTNQSIGSTTDRSELITQSISSITDNPESTNQSIGSSMDHSESITQSISYITDNPETTNQSFGSTTDHPESITPSIGGTITPSQSTSTPPVIKPETERSFDSITIRPMELDVSCGLECDVDDHNCEAECRVGGSVAD